MCGKTHRFPPYSSGGIMGSGGTPMKRFTILSLMGLILALAVAIAALRNADDYWAGWLILATPLLLGIALIGALCGRERSRAGRLGFAILGGGYFALAFLGPSEKNNRLPTNYLLSYVHEQVAPPPTAATFTTVFVTNPAPATSPNTIAVANSNPVPWNLAATFTGNATSTAGLWVSVVPGAANFEAFSTVGHCLFALLAGLLGAAIARWFQRRSDRPEEASPAPDS
jgi:hypothetical protein